MNNTTLPAGRADGAASDRIAEDNRRLLWMHRALVSGEIGVDEYRDQRREIIDRVAGTGPLRSVAAMAPASSASVTAPGIPRLEVPGSAAAAPVRLQDPPDDHPQGRSDIVLGIAVVGVVLVVLAALLAFFW